jgi:biotin transporter BioY
LAALLPQTVTPYVALMLAGFAVGILGHLAGSRWVVAAGVILIALGAMLLPLIAHIAG